MEMESLQELYVEELRDLYSAERQSLKKLPRLIRAASDRKLKQAFTTHEKQARNQVKRLERVFRELGEKPTGKKCKGMEGLLAEGEELIQEKPEPEVLDAGLIAAAQRVEHYEIAGYGTVRAYAQHLGFDRPNENDANAADRGGVAGQVVILSGRPRHALSAANGSRLRRGGARSFGFASG